MTRSDQRTDAGGGDEPRRLPAIVGGIAAAGAPVAWWLVRHCRSPAVRAWRAPTIRGTHVGDLHARIAGDGDKAVVLLHGLVSSGDVFGAAYDRLATVARLVVPDLLGFGRSMDESRSSFPVDAHLSALDDLAEDAGLFQRRWTVGAHSMGSALALQWALRHADRIDRVVCWGPPIYGSPRAARTRITGSRMARLVVLDTAWAERACAISCRHRDGVGVLTAAVEPDLPVAVARAVTRHTWPAYRDAMRHLVLEPDWEQLLADLDQRRVPIRLVWGSEDPVGDPDLAGAYADAGQHTGLTRVPGADHYLPMTHPALCLAHLGVDVRGRRRPDG